MRKHPTPMTRLVKNFASLESILTDGVEVLNLNKAKSRYRPIGRFSSQDNFVKGVKSDFIRIYEHNNFTETLAFAFSYMHGGEPSIIATKRTGKIGNYKFSTSKPMTLDNFRERLNGFNRLLGLENSHEFPKFIEIFIEQFLQDSLEKDTEFKEIKALYLEAISPAVAAQERYLNEFRLNDEQLKAASIAIATDIQATEDYKQLEALRLQMRSLENKVKVHRRNANRAHGLHDLEAKQNSLRNEKYDTHRGVETAKRKYLQQYPWYVIAELESDFKF